MIFSRINQLQCVGDSCRLIGRLLRWLRGRCRSTFRTLNDLSRGEPLRDLRDLYPHVLALLRPRDKDHKSVDFGNAIATPAGFRDTDVVLLTNLDWLVEGTGTSPVPSSISVSSALSETQLLSHILPLFDPVATGFWRPN